jgi:hypothetical protein
VEGPDTDARLALEVRPLSERKYLVGEPILLELQFRNVSPTAVVVDLGHRGRQSLTVEYEGQVYESEFLKTCPGGISRGYRASLGPGEVFSHTILLNEWVRFTKEGTYSLRLVYDGSQSFVKESSGLRATCPLMITVVAKEEGTLQPILEGYYRKATGKPFFQAELDFLALCFSGQDEALPFLRKVLPGALQGDSDSQIELFKGVRRVGTLAALDLLAEWMKSENQGIAHMATVEVGLIERTSPDPAVRARAGELLKEVPRDFRFVEPAIVD